MDSVLECIGIYITDANEFAAFAATAGATAMRFGTADSAELFRWQDASGARLAFAMTDDGRVLAHLPSFASPAQIRLSNVRVRDGEVARAQVVDRRGDQVAALRLSSSSVPWHLDCNSHMPKLRSLVLRTPSQSTSTRRPSPHRRRACSTPTRTSHPPHRSSSQSTAGAGRPDSGMNPCCRTARSFPTTPRPPTHDSPV